MAKNLGGRPRCEIDFERVDLLCSLHCTEVEIANACGVTLPTLRARIKEQLTPDGEKYTGFLHYFDIKSGRGKTTLRKLQWDSAKKGNVAMQIFLGKNLLDQTEKQQVDVNAVEEITVDFFEADDDDDQDDDE